MTLQSPPKAEEPQGNPYAPALPPPQIMETFAGVNTSTTRAGVPDKMCYWIDGFMPIAPRNLRTLPGVGAQLIPSLGSTIVFFGFYNLGSKEYAIYFLADGSVRTTNTVGTPVTLEILPPGSITTPLITGAGFAQWGQSYLIIVANQTNGYWIWDGTILYDAGTLSPIVTLTNPGTGYQTVPLVTASGGSGTGATFAAFIANGVVTGVTLTNPGMGYLAGQNVSLVFTGGQASGTGATLSALMTDGAGSGASLSAIMISTGAGAYSIASISVVDSGANYSPLTYVAAYGGTVVFGRNPAFSPVISGGSIIAVTVINPGEYATNFPPLITATDSGTYYVSSVSIINRGSGYSGTADVTVTGGSSPIYVPAAVSLLLANGSVSSVLITNPGQYGGSVAPTLTVVDTLTSAAGSVSLMPFGIQGTAIESYQGRAWVCNGPIIYFTAPGSFTDFATSDGGGNLTSGDSFLRVGYIRLVNTNGFLYLIADSSTNYISGVTTSGTPPTTTFTNQNVDPEVGTPYPGSVLCLGNDIVLANSFGIHVSRSAAFAKISEALDGVWGSVANFGGLQLSAAKATVFGKKIWMVLATIVDPLAGATQNKLLIWNGKDWYASLQNFGPLTYIATQEINSVLTAWGTDGNVIRPLFTTPSTAFNKIVQSRLWDEPGGYQFSKATGRFWSVWEYNTNLNPDIIVNIDAVGISGANGTTFNNTQTYTITGPIGTGYFVTPPQAVGQQGVLTGMTILTAEADVSLVSAMIQSDPRVAYRG